MNKTRLVAALLVCCIAAMLGLPAHALAAGPLVAAAPQVDQATALATQAADDEAQDGSSVEAQPVAEAFATQSLLELYQDERLDFTEGLADAAISDSESYWGVVLKAKRDVLQSGRIELADEFDFGAQTVGRILVDGLSERGWSVTLDVYLDDDEEPVASIALPHQQGKVGMAFPGDRTVDVLARNITGKHRVSLAISAAKDNDPEANKKTSVLLRSIEFAQSSVPTIFFNIDESKGSIASMNASENHSRECYGSMTVQVPEGYTFEYTGETADQLTENTYELEYLRGRGNSTWMADKKPYKVKLDKKADLFGMGANKHWVLLANRYDNSLLRNKATYWLGEQLGLAYTPQCVFVDVVMNGEYYGSYYLCEQVRVGDSRVDIADLEDDPDATDAPAVTGGYLLSMEGNWEFDNSLDSAHGFYTDGGYAFTIEHPEYEDYDNEAQVAYIKDFVQKVEDAVNADDHTADGLHYSEYLDVKSAIDYYWLQDISLNGDAYISGSTYLYKDRDGEDTPAKLCWGPLWDFDYVAWGDLEYDEPNVEGFRFNEAPWCERLLEDEEFAKAMLERWPVIKEKLEELTREGGMLDTWRDQLAVSKFYDTEKYGPYEESGWDWSWFYGSDFAIDLDEDGYAILGDGEEAQGEEGSDTAGYEGDEDIDGDFADMDLEQRSYAEEVEQFRNWIVQRVAWIDDNIDHLVPEAATVEFYVDGKPFKTIDGRVGYELGSLPEAPEKDGMFFRGWEYRVIDDDGEEYTDYASEESVVTGTTMRLDASYVDESEAVLPADIFFERDKASITLDYDEFYMNYQVMPADALELIEWSSSDPAVAHVTDDGTVIPLSEGDATITASCPGGATASYELHIGGDELYDIDAEELALPESLELNEGAYEKLTANVTPEDALVDGFDWVSLDPSVAIVGYAGVVEAVGPGTTYVLARSYGDTDLLGACKVTVTADKQPEGEAADKPADNAGEAKGNARPEAETKPAAEVKEVVKTVKVIGDATISKIANQVYTGKKISPKLVVTSAGRTLVEGSDYEVSYANNKKVGTATATVSFKGALEGTKSATFKIVPNGTSIKKLATNKKSITVKWAKASKKAAKQITGYRVQVSTSKNFKKNVKTVFAPGAKKTSKVVKGLKKNKTYYVRVCAYKKVGSKKYRSEWSQVQSVKLSKEPTIVACNK